MNQSGTAFVTTLTIQCCTNKCMHTAITIHKWLCFFTPFLAATVLLWEFASWASSGIADHCCCKQYVANNYCIFFWIESIALTLEINESLATLEINESLATNKFLLHGRCTSMHITVYITPYMYNRKYTPNIGKIPPFIDAYKRKTLYRHINMWFYLDIVTV